MSEKFLQNVNELAKLNFQPPPPTELPPKLQSALDATLRKLAVQKGDVVLFNYGRYDDITYDTMQFLKQALQKAAGGEVLLLALPHDMTVMTVSPAHRAELIERISSLPTE